MQLTLKTGQYPKTARETKLHKNALQTKKRVAETAKRMAKLDNREGVDTSADKDVITVSGHVSTGKKISNLLTLTDSRNGSISGSAKFSENGQELESLDVNKEEMFPLYGGRDDRTIFKTLDDGSKVYFSEEVGSGTLVHERKDGVLFIEDHVSSWRAEGFGENKASSPATRPIFGSRLMGLGFSLPSANQLHTLTLGSMLKGPSTQQNIQDSAILLNN